MSTKKECPDCGAEVVLVNSGGVHRTIICSKCNREMKYAGDAETEWVGIEDEHDNYKIVQ